jgi:glycosyltransferase involved in cell wall biosynthesis
MKIVALIPAYNEEKTIQEIVRNTKKFVSEVIVVDDNSNDRTKDLAIDEGADVIPHKKNKGYGSAIITGIKRALYKNADIIVLLDADAQHKPNEISSMVKPILERRGDLVIGSRFLNNVKIPMYRKFGIKFITILMNLLTGVKITDAQSGFRAFSSKVLREISLKEHGMGISVETIFKVKEKNFKIVEVPISCQYEKIIHKINPMSHGLQVISSILTYFIKTL